MTNVAFSYGGVGGAESWAKGGGRRSCPTMSFTLDSSVALDKLLQCSGSHSVLRVLGMLSHKGRD